MILPPPTHEEELDFVADGQELVVYRNVKSDDPESVEFADSLRSNADLGRPPRGHETTHPLIHSGVSAWETLEQAVANAQKFPALGPFVAEIRLTSASGARYFRWGARPGHLTVWAEPLTLREATADTMSVGYQG